MFQFQIRRHFGHLLLGLGGFALLAGLHAEARSQAPQASIGSFVQDDAITDFASFEVTFNAAIEKLDTRAMTKMLEKYPEWGQRHAVEMMRRIAWTPNERYIEDARLLRVAWKEAYDNDFLTRVEKFFTGLPSSLRTQRGSVLSAWQNAYDMYWNLRNKPKGKERNEQLLDAGRKLEEAGDAFMEIGDLYYAALAYQHAGLAHHENTVGDKDQDVATAARCFTRMLEAYDRLDLEDPDTDWYRGQLAEFEKLGVDGGMTAEEAKSITPGMKFGPPRTLDSVYRLIASATELDRPSFRADPAYVTWGAVYLQGEGSQATFGAKQDGVLIKRLGAAEIEVTGADGVAEVHKLTGNLTLVETTTGEQKLPWSFLFQTGKSSDYFHEIGVNLEPNSDFLTLYVLPASGMTVDVDGTPVTIIDDNADGIYGSPPQTYEYPGMGKGEYQPEMDTIAIGATNTVIPFSNFVQIGKSWFQIETQADGQAFRMTPIEEIRTGELVLDFAGPKPSWLILRGMDNLENAFFDLTESKKVAVPVGRYQLYYGGFREGKRADGMQKAIVVPGPKSKVWTVTEGTETPVELGAPFDLDFTYTAEAERVTIKGSSVTVTGRGNERYHRLWNLRLAPEVLIRKAGKGSGAKAGRMRLISDADTLNVEGYDKAWWPEDFEFENKYAGEAVEVQLLEKKNKLFGKLESSWREPK